MLSVECCVLYCVDYTLYTHTHTRFTYTILYTVHCMRHCHSLCLGPQPCPSQPNTSSCKPTSIPCFLISAPLAAPILGPPFGPMNSPCPLLLPTSRSKHMHLLRICIALHFLTHSLIRSLFTIFIREFYRYHYHYHYMHTSTLYTVRGPHTYL